MLGAKRGGKWRSERKRGKGEGKEERGGKRVRIRRKAREER
jgi:hypothetical protein